MKLIRSKRKLLLAAGLPVLLAACAVTLALALRSQAKASANAGISGMLADDGLRTENLSDGARLAADTEPVPRVYEQVPVLEFRVSELSASVSTEMDYVDWWYCQWEDARYLFLPSTADRSKLKLSYKASGTLYLNGRTVTSGTVTDLFKEDEISVRVGTVDCGKLYVMQSELPVMYMSTATGTTYKLDHDTTKKYVETGKLVCVNPDGSADYAGDMESLKRHGNSSWDYSFLYNLDMPSDGNIRDYALDFKRPYNMKLPEKAKLFGMGKAKKWVLLSNAMDQSQLRNRIAQTMAARSGLEYVMESVSIDLYCDGSYRGVYQLSERVQIQKQRVNITDMEEAMEALNDKELNEYQEVSVGGDLKDMQAGSYRYYEIPNQPADITGGYLIQFQLCNRYEKTRWDRSGFVTNRGQCVQLSSPEYASKDQVLYIRNFVQELEDAIYSETGYNAKGKHYSDYLDVDSLLLGYLLQEITMNPDGQWTSFFFYKDSDSAGDGKLHYGPPWDFDLGYINYSKSFTDFTGMYTDAKGNPMVFAASNVNSLYVMHQAVHTYGHLRDAKDPTSIQVPEAEPLGWLGTLYLKEEPRVAELYYERFVPVLEELSLATGTKSAGITQMGEAMLGGGNMNAARWHAYGGKPYKPLLPYNADSFEGCVEFVRSFVERRMEGLKKIWAEPAKQVLSEKLPGELDPLPLERYDDTGRAELQSAVEAGQEAVLAAETFADAQTAYKQAQSAITAIPRAEIPGDFNDDLTVDIHDVQSLLMRYAMELAELNTGQLSSTQLRNGDTDKNGRIDAVDAMHILRCLSLRIVGADYDFATGQAVFSDG